MYDGRWAFTIQYYLVRRNCQDLEGITLCLALVGIEHFSDFSDFIIFIVRGGVTLATDIPFANGQLDVDICHNI
jgi:hypothetical protein